jgi:hypothetical protein
VRLLRRLHPADDALAPAVRVFDDNFDGVHSIRRATSSGAAAACYSSQLVTQDRVHALQERGAYGAATALAGGEADADVVVDCEAHPTGDKATIAVRPCPSVALLEDHDSGVFI